jgi:ribose/xylose/arabinose/galactoside ABC-type transport system permease subunit
MNAAGAQSQIVKRSQFGVWLAQAPGAVYLLAVLSIGLTILTPNFFSIANLTNVTLQIAVLVIVALGMTLVILTEGIDLSLGPVLGLCGVVMGMMVVTDWPLWMASTARWCPTSTCRRSSSRSVRSASPSRWRPC